MKDNVWKTLKSLTKNVLFKMSQSKVSLKMSQSKMSHYKYILQQNVSPKISFSNCLTKNISYIQKVSLKMTYLKCLTLGDFHSLWSHDVLKVSRMQFFSWHETKCAYRKKAVTLLAAELSRVNHPYKRLVK